MLNSIHIENVALIRSIDIDLSSGFTALTGETGAGKSIFIDSIRLLGGSRADKELIREGSDMAFVSGVFSDFDERTLDKLAELSVFPDENGEIIISRSVDKNGKNRAKVSGRTVSIGELREIGDILIAIHGQFDSMKLLDPGEHIKYLDLYSGCEALLEEYKEVFSAMTESRLKFKKNADELKRKLQEVPGIRAGLREIEDAGIKPGEEEKLLEKRAQLKGSAKLFKNVALIGRTLSGTDNIPGAVSLIKIAETTLSKISDGIESGSEYLERLASISAELSAINDGIRHSAKDFDEDPSATLERIEERLSIIDKLKKKYGDLDTFREEAERTLAFVESASEICEKCKDELKVLSDKAFALSEKLTSCRKKAAKELEKAVIDELRFLDLPKIRFEVSIAEKTLQDGKLKLTEDGSDEVSFLISPNVGEGMKELIKIASGGEASRIMLALRTVFADRYNIPTMIFDEIDTGISGKTSEKIGIKLRSIAEKGCTQIFCVTHSAQVASCSNIHLKIEKKEQGGRTETFVRPLGLEERIGEIARIMGGIDITENVLASAREMINKNN